MSAMYAVRKRTPWRSVALARSGLLRDQTSPHPGEVPLRAASLWDPVSSFRPPVLREMIEDIRCSLRAQSGRVHL